MEGDAGVIGRWGGLQSNDFPRAHTRILGGANALVRIVDGGKPSIYINGGADVLVRRRRPGRIFDRDRRLILRGKSGTGASRADQGVRPTACAKPSLPKTKLSGIGLDCQAEAMLACPKGCNPAPPVAELAGNSKRLRRVLRHRPAEGGYSAGESVTAAPTSTRPLLSPFSAGASGWM
jgi:hypothetical protein